LLVINVYNVYLILVFEECLVLKKNYSKPDFFHKHRFWGTRKFTKSNHNDKVPTKIIFNFFRFLFSYYYGFWRCSTNPIQNSSPPFHGDALENGEHGQPDVVERRDPVVRTDPVLYARGRRVITEIRVVWLRVLARVRVRIARRRFLSLDFHRNQIIQPNASTQKHYTPGPWKQFADEAPTTYYYNLSMWQYNMVVARKRTRPHDVIIITICCPHLHIAHQSVYVIIFVISFTFKNTY